MPWIKLTGVQVSPPSTILVALDRILFVRNFERHSTVYVAAEGQSTGFTQIEVQETGETIESALRDAGEKIGHV